VEAVAAIPAELPPVATAPVGSLAPGISRFKVLEPRLAAGSLPSAAGWAWLAETGYRTVLDLREPTEVKTSELAEINHQGLRYVACPFDSQSIDAKQLARFYAEIEQDPARPLFVFDLDASRPAALWYIHQVEKRLETTEIAAREIEELGATGHPLLVAANTYLKARKQESAPAPATSSPGARKPETQAVSPRTETVAPIAALVPRSAPEPQATGLVIPANSAEPRSETIPDEEGHELDLPTESPADHSWKTMAGIVTTGLGFPLLFMSGRQVVQTARARASLPSPSRGTRALPSSSDE
jgi:protein tyrosine phosphatase (PTP) superfamily phosphohydrolase (DUF442 family)